MTKVYFSIILLFVFLNSEAQVSSGGYPASWEYSLPDAQTINLPANPQASNLKNTPINKHGALKFAEVIKVNLGTSNSGTWQTLNNGDKIWRLKLRSEGAFSLNFTFSKYKIPNGAKVFVYNTDGSKVLGAFTSANIKKSGFLPIAPIAGDELIIEYIEPSNSDFSGELFISQLGHDYLGIFGKKDGQFGKSDDCNIDINCPEGEEWQVEKRGVCRMVINNKELCTGTLINNQLKDGKPYILSANHCANSQDLAEKTIFLFNYESPTCNGSDGSNSQSISGASLLATKNNDEVPGYLDFALYELSTIVPNSYNPYFAGWDASATIAEKTTGIHHPQGDVKKVSHDFDPPIVSSYSNYDPNTFWKIQEWDNGLTEGGSSGSAIFNQNHLIVGSLTGGDTQWCGTTYNDYYQMFSVSYSKYNDPSNQLKAWLDPNNTGINKLSEYDPSNQNGISDIKAIYHWDTDEELAFYPIEGGYVSGNNALKDKTKSERFTSTDYDKRNMVIGGYVFFFMAKGNDAEDIEFFVYDNLNGKPNTKIASTSLTMAEIKKETAEFNSVYFEFDAPVSVYDTLYAGITLPQTIGDTLVVFNTEIKPELNYAWEQEQNGNWQAYSNRWEGNWINYISVKMGELTSINSTNLEQKMLKLFPNPANTCFTIELNHNNQKSVINVFNSVGVLVYSKSATSNHQVDCSNWNKGLYIVTVKNANTITTGKLVINN